MVSNFPGDSMEGMPAEASNGEVPFSSTDSNASSPLTPEEQPLKGGKGSSDTVSKSERDGATPRLQHIPMPIAARSLCTHSYQRALLNRVKESSLAAEGCFNTRSHRSAFLHGILMLPGTLTSLFGKNTPEEIIPKMTPALLPGFEAQVEVNTLQPHLVPSPDSEAHVQGMIIFGLGKEDSDLIHKHYRATGLKRRKVHVEIEIATWIPECDGSPDGEWHLSRRTAKSYAWVSKHDPEPPERLRGVKWTLEDFLEGNLEASGVLPLRVEPNGKGDEDEDGYIGRDIEYYELEAEVREIVYSGSGSLNYARADHFTGW